MGQFIKISPFSGMLPRVARRLLPDGAAVDASNLMLSSGELLPIKKSSFVTTPSGSGPWLSVYRPEWSGSEKWLAWTKDVDIARAPLSKEVESRYYWTGDNEPRYSKFSSLPSTFYALGIPKPLTAPTVLHSGGVGSVVSRVYVYTFFSVLGEESAPSPANSLSAGKVDGTWAISAMDAFPASSGAGTAVHFAGVTTFTNAGNHWLRAGDEITLSATKMVVVSTPTNTTFTVAGNYAAATSWTRVAPWNTSGMKRRLYRSAGTVASYQLVSDDVGTAYNDTLTDALILGDELISSGWLPPPTGLRGMLALPNGAMVGFFGSLICYSEPYQPHAWPVVYQLGTDHEIVGIDAYGTTVVAGTTGKPYVFSGNDPSSVSPDSVNEIWPCLSKRSIVSVGDGVMYATTNGLAYVGTSGAKIWTDSLFTKIKWQPLAPASMVSAVSDGKIYVRWLGIDLTKGIMVFDPSNPGLGLTLLSFVPDELYSDARNGGLYLVDTSGIYKFDSESGEKAAYSWVSKEYYLPTPINFGAVKIDFVSEIEQVDFDAIMAAYAASVAANAVNVSGYKGFGSLNKKPLNTTAIADSNIAEAISPNLPSVAFSMYCDGELKYSSTVVAGTGLLRPTAGFKYQTVQIALNGTAQVKSVRLAETPRALKEIP